MLEGMLDVLLEQDVVVLESAPLVQVCVLLEPALLDGSQLEPVLLDVSVLEGIPLVGGIMLEPVFLACVMQEGILREGVLLVGMVKGRAVLLMS